MFSHIMIGANDIEESKKFYDAALGAMGHEPGRIDAHGRCFYMTKNNTFALSKPIDGEPATAANGGTIGFTAATTEQADAWYREGLANGGVACEDPPGLRESPFGGLYLAYLRDPAGNKICAMKRMK